ncbi:MAG: bacterial Ig-like domain-containing protein [Clostridiales Family XIII bacterium]|nr:bacterial Ig-like domain-containing protein [Clostridiales Family XIII bacterium]
MKSRGKKFAMLMVLLLVLSAFAPVGAAYAVDGPEIAVGAVSGKLGQEVQVSMNIANNPGVIAAVLDLGYGDELELVSVTVDDQCVLSVATLAENIEAKPYRVLLENKAVSDTSANGILATLKFKIKVDATPGDKPITVAGASGMGSGAIGNYNEDEIADSFTFTPGKVTVLDKEITGITLKTAPTKTTYLEGAPLELSGGMITVSYDNSTSEDVPITAGMITGYNANTVGAQTLTVTYEGRTVTFGVTVTAKSLASIAVTTPPTKTVYIEGQTFDPADMVVTATYDNSTQAPVTGYTVDPTPLTLGTTSVTITYNGQTTTQAVTVNAKSLDRLEIPTPSAYKREYIEGQTFDKTLLAINAYYDNDTFDPAVAYTIDDPDALLTVGQTYVTARYQSLTLQVPITVRAKQPTGISVTTPPTKTDYIVDQVIDPAGGVITVTYDNGANALIPITTAMLNPKNAGSAVASAKAITVSYAENGVTKTASFTIGVRELTVASIAITSNPAKLSYIEGQDLDLSGGTIRVTYEDTSEATVPMANATISGYNKNQTGPQTITVAYKGQSDTFGVTVAAKTPTGLTLDTSKAKKAYLEGQDLDTSNLGIRVAFDNGLTETKAVSACTITGYDAGTLGAQTVTVSYTENSATVSGAYGVTVYSRENANAVIDDIDALYEGIDDLTFEDEDAVNDLNAAYNALMDIEKEAVTNKAKLDALTAKMKELLYPAYDDAKLADGAVDVHAPVGVIPHDARITIDKKAVGTAPTDAIKKQFGDGSVIYAVFDINLLQNGMKILPNGFVEIGIAIDAAWAGPGLAVLRAENDGTLTNMNARVEDGRLVFMTDHFSDYIVAKLAEAPSSGPIVTNDANTPKTGDDMPMALWIAIGAIALLLLAGSVVGYARLNGGRRRA